MNFAFKVKRVEETKGFREKRIKTDSCLSYAMISKSDTAKKKKQRKSNECFKINHPKSERRRERESERVCREKQRESGLQK